MDEEYMNRGCCEDTMGPSRRTLRDVRLSNPLVRDMIFHGASMEEVVVALDRALSVQTKRLVELEGLAPRKVRTADGKELIWRCPPDLVPMVEDLRITTETEHSPTGD